MHTNYPEFYKELGFKTCTVCFKTSKHYFECCDGVKYGTKPIPRAKGQKRKREIEENMNEFNLVASVSENLNYFELYPDIQENLEEVEKIVEINCFTYEYANEEIRKNKKIAIIAVQGDNQMLQYAHTKLKNDFDVVMAAVTAEYGGGWSLEFASKRLQDNDDIVMAAVSSEGPAIEFASERLQDNYDIVMTAVQQHGSALEFASERLQKNEKLITCSVIKSIIREIEKSK